MLYRIFASTDPTQEKTCPADHAGCTASTQQRDELDPTDQERMYISALKSDLDGNRLSVRCEHTFFSIVLPVYLGTKGVDTYPGTRYQVQRQQRRSVYR